MRVSLFSTCMYCSSVLLMQRCAMLMMTICSDDDDEELAGIAEGLTPVDISDDSDEEFNDE